MGNLKRNVQFENICDFGGVFPFLNMRIPPLYAGHICGIRKKRRLRIPAKPPFVHIQLAAIVLPDLRLRRI